MKQFITILPHGKTVEIIKYFRIVIDVKCKIKYLLIKFVLDPMLKKMAKLF